MFKKKLLASLILASAVPLSANAAKFVGVDTVNDIASFDWAAASVLADGGNQAFVDFVNSSGTCTGTASECKFNVYGHGNLSAFADAANAPISAPGLGASYEITYEFGFSEKVTFAVPAGTTNVATFGFGPSGNTTGPYSAATDAVMADGTTPNFFRMYVDSVDADPLAGTGFGNGTLLLAGQILPVGAFTTGFNASTATPVAIGGVSSTTPAAWAGVTTVTGSGATSTIDLAVMVTTFNQTYFPNQTLDAFLMSNISQLLPFTTTNPSLTFPEGGIVDAKGDVAGAGANINGGTTIGGGGVLVATNKSIIFQNDSNSPISTTNIPEPGLLAMVGLGFLGIGAVKRRREHKAS
ncbi:MAG: PEP-CTERM sorting domain-containing protein [Gammaproteobacteria bacterium]|nr:PEP-CTERM sorting domain-containing protein [Gammaproteobacteria bacterium]